MNKNYDENCELWRFVDEWRYFLCSTVMTLGHDTTCEDD